MRLLRIVLALAVLVFPVWPAAAQALTDDIDQLFAMLRDPASGSLTLRIEPKIWTIWMHAGNDAENEKLEKATLSMNIGDFKGSEQQLTELVTSSPKFSEAWNKRATLYFVLGRYEESLADVAKTLNLEPRHFGALSGRGMIYEKLGRNVEALKSFKEALSIHPHLTGASLAIQRLEKTAPEL